MFRCILLKLAGVGRSLHRHYRACAPTCDQIIGDQKIYNLSAELCPYGRFRAFIEPILCVAVHHGGFPDPPLSDDDYFEGLEEVSLVRIV